MKLINSFRFALNGIYNCFLSEMNLRIHVVVAIVAILSGIFTGLSAFEWLVVLLCIFLVFGFEMINTAIELLCDRMSTSYDPFIKKIKDISAGAVLLISIMSMIAGCIIYLPKIIYYLKHFV